MYQSKESDLGDGKISDDRGARSIVTSVPRMCQESNAAPAGARAASKLQLSNPVYRYSDLTLPHVLDWVAMLHGQLPSLFTMAWPTSTLYSPKRQSVVIGSEKLSAAAMLI